MLANGGWDLTLILLTWTIWRAPTNASKWQMGFNSAFKGLLIKPENPRPYFALQIIMSKQKHFFEIYRQSGHASSKSFASRGLGGHLSCRRKRS